MRQLSLQASAILSLLTAVASFTSDANGPNGQSTLSNRPLTSPQQESKASTFAPFSNDNVQIFASQQTQRSQRDRQGERMKSIMRPPLVDSDLLRFLSEQKKLKSLQQQQLEAILSPNSNNVTSTSSTSVQKSWNLIPQSSSTTSRWSASPTLAMPMSYLDTLSRFWAEEAAALSTPLPPLERESSTATSKCDNVVDDDTSRGVYQDDVDNSWLGQYNHHRVSSVLLQQSRGDQPLDPQLAARAGERVQSQALARTARRRVRTFLKERDLEWSMATKTTTTPSSSVASDERTTGSTALSASSSSSPSSTLYMQTVSLNDDETAESTITLSGTSEFASTSSISYGFEDTVNLLLEYGLTTKDICEILIHSPGVALMRPRATPSSKGESLQETMDRVFVSLLWETLALRKYDARKVLRTCPSLLTMRGSRSAEHVVKMLSRLGVSTSSLARDKSGLPTLLLRPPSALFRLVAFLASDAVRMPVPKIGPLLRRSECQALLDVVAPVPRLGETTREFGMLRNDETDPSVVAALWGSSSQQRRHVINDTYRNMSKTAWTLRHEIGTADLGKVIAAYPSVLLQDAECQILPAARFLMNELGIWEDDLPRVLQLYPALLGIEIDKMRQVADYLVSLEVEPGNLGSIFRSFPALLTLSVEHDMAPVVAFLRSVGIGNIGRFVTRLPPVLTYSIESELRPKWEFLQTLYVDPRFEATKFPAYFSYPLERVIKTRFCYLRQVKLIPTQLAALDKVLCYGDKDFATKVAGDTDEGRAFAAYAEKRRQSLMEASSPARKPKRRKETPPTDEGVAD